MALLTPEEILRRIKTLYESDYAADLAEVQAIWAATEDIPLHDFEDRRIGVDPNRIPVVKQLPALIISMGNTIATGDKTQLMEDLYEMEVYCVYVLRSNDDHEMALLLARHIQATMLFFSAHPRLGFGNECRVTEIAFYPSESYMPPGGGNIMNKALGVKLTVRFLQYGI